MKKGEKKEERETLAAQSVKLARQQRKALDRVCQNRGWRDAGANSVTVLRRLMMSSWNALVADYEIWIEVEGKLQKVMLTRRQDLPHSFVVFIKNWIANWIIESVVIRSFLTFDTGCGGTENVFPTLKLVVWNDERTFVWPPAQCKEGKKRNESSSCCSKWNRKSTTVQIISLIEVNEKEENYWMCIMHYVYVHRKRKCLCSQRDAEMKWNLSWSQLSPGTWQNRVSHRWSPRWPDPVKKLAHIIRMPSNQTPVDVPRRDSMEE